MNIEKNESEHFLWRNKKDGTGNFAKEYDSSVIFSSKEEDELIKASSPRSLANWFLEDILNTRIIHTTRKGGLARNKRFLTKHIKYLSKKNIKPTIARYSKTYIHIEF